MTVAEFIVKLQEYPKDSELKVRTAFGNENKIILVAEKS